MISPLDPSNLRKRIVELDDRRRDLLAQLLRPSPMVIGYLYKMRRRCGSPRCKCSRGELHSSWYLSRRQEGRTKLTYVGRVVPQWLGERVGRYRQYQKRLAAMRKMDAEISRLLNQLRDEKVQTLEQATKRR
ncbi:MAG: hypothetical protein QHH14_14865 [Clostridiales bacterium]|jgi:hypothetical protein|nr:hypothetical protein [Clostridiales bacterium]